MKTLCWAALLTVVTVGGYLGSGGTLPPSLFDAPANPTLLYMIFEKLCLPLLLPFVILRGRVGVPSLLAWIAAALVHFLCCLLLVRAFGPLVRRTWRIFREGGRARRRALWVLLALVAAVSLLIRLLSPDIRQLD